MRTTTSRTVMLGLAVLTAAMLAVPSTVGQTLQVTDLPGPQNIRPEIETKAMKVKFQYAFDNQVTQVLAVERTTVPVSISHNCPAYVIVTGPSLVLGAISAGQTGPIDIEANFDVATTRQAPGLQQIKCSMTSSAGAISAAETVANGPTDPQTQDYSVSAAYYGAMQVKVGTPLQKAGPQKEVNFELELTNFGNAKTSVLFSLGSEPSGKRWEQILPPPIIVDTLATGGQNKEIATFQVSTPYKTGWNNEIGTYQVVMSTAAFDDPNQVGNTMTADVLVRVRGVYVPGFEAVALVGALGAAGIVLRRDEE